MPRLLAAACLLAFVTLAGRRILGALVPFVGLLPPGPVLQVATGFATAVPLLIGAIPVGAMLGRWGRQPLGRAAGAVGAAAALSLCWEVSRIGVATVLSTGPDFLLGRLLGWGAAILAGAAACRRGGNAGRRTRWISSFGESGRSSPADRGESAWGSRGRWRRRDAASD